MVQTGPTTLVPSGDANNFEFGGNYSAWLEIRTEGETLTSPMVTSTSQPEGAPLEFDPEDGAYIFEADFETLGEITTEVPADTYTFTGTGSVSGSFSETVTLGAYSPLTPLRVVNFEELQSFDPSQPLTIEWEPFTEGLGEGPNLGYAGVINVDIIRLAENSNSIVWDSDSVTPEGAFGLLPTTNSVTIPAGTLDANSSYYVDLFFSRIDSAQESQSVSGALRGALTSYEVGMVMNPGPTDPNPADPTWGGFPVQFIDNNNYINTESWMGWLIVDQAPWLYSLSLSKYVYIPESLVAPEGGWIFVPKF